MPRLPVLSLSGHLCNWAGLQEVSLPHSVQEDTAPGFRVSLTFWDL